MVSFLILRRVRVLSWRKSDQLFKLRYNKLIIENYFHDRFTVIEFFFYIIIYPFVIRKLGAENYGLCSPIQ
jgi:hypothetical protein